MSTAHEEALERVFAAFDLQNAGYIEKDGLKKLCENFALSEEEVDAIFNDLDHDNDGKLTKQDFLYGFEGVLAGENYVGSNHAPPRVKDDDDDDVVEGEEEAEDDESARRRRAKGRVIRQHSLDLQWSRFVADMGLDYNLLSTPR